MFNNVSVCVSACESACESVFGVTRCEGTVCSSVSV